HQPPSELYTLSYTTLFRSGALRNPVSPGGAAAQCRAAGAPADDGVRHQAAQLARADARIAGAARTLRQPGTHKRQRPQKRPLSLDRKSTRLNSSHVKISYA